MNLQRFSELPKEFFQLEPKDIHQIFSEPTLIRVGEGSKRPAFFSTLLHGNETTGLLALQQLLKNSLGFDREILIFIGNPQAARQQMRMLPHQTDFNRVWDENSKATYAFAEELLNEVREAQPFLCIDLHNTSGKNPLYPCVTHVERQHLSLAKRFGEQIVYFKEPHQVLSAAFADTCPSITLECGLPGEHVEEVANELEELLRLEALPNEAFSGELYHSEVRIKIPEELSISFDSRKADIHFRPGIDYYNFRLIEHDLKIGERGCQSHYLIAIDENNKDVSEACLRYEGNEIFLKAGVVPSMLSTKADIVKQDSLCYLMETIKVEL